MDVPTLGHRLPDVVATDDLVDALVKVHGRLQAQDRAARAGVLEDLHATSLANHHVIAAENGSSLNYKILANIYRRRKTGTRVSVATQGPSSVCLLRLYLRNACIMMIRDLL